MGSILGICISLYIMVSALAISFLLKQLEHLSIISRENEARIERLENWYLKRY